MIRKERPARYSLRELAEAVGLAPRTVRSYIEKGLLPGPEGAGRAASYDEEHLLRLKAIRVMQELDGLTLEAIRRYLLGLDRDEIAHIAARFETLGAGGGPPFGDLPERDMPAIENRVRRQSFCLPMFHEDAVPGIPLHAEKVERLWREPGSQKGEGRLAGPSWRRDRIAALKPGARRDADPGPAAGSRRRPGGRAEPMTRIEVTPDIDLVVRGVQDERRIRHLERIAAQIRRLLMGRD